MYVSVKMAHGGFYESKNVLHVFFNTLILSA
jgi:hypothetical protein